MTRLNPFVVLTGTALSYKVVGDTPTPALIDASNDGRRHEAYQHPDTGFWRLRDEKYDPPGTVYTEVYVAHLPECPGDQRYGMSHLVEWGTKLYRGRCLNDATVGRDLSLAELAEARGHALEGDECQRCSSTTSTIEVFHWMSCDEVIEEHEAELAAETVLS